MHYLIIAPPGPALAQRLKSFGWGCHFATIDVFDAGKG